jgi:PAS domain S-box-containing protein
MGKIKSAALFAMLLWVICHSGYSREPGPERSAELSSPDTITMCVDPDGMPFESNITGGKYIGLVSNILLIGQITSIIILIMSAALLWNYKLRRFNIQLKEKQDQLIELSESQSEMLYAREQIEASLLESKIQLERMVSNLPGFIYRCNFDEDYSMQLISKGCEAITGYLSDDFIKTDTINFNKLIHPDDREEVRRKWNQALSQKAHYQHHFRIIHRHGSIRYLWERGQGIFSDAGQLLFLEGFITDITEQTLAQKELRHSEQKLRLITANSSDVIWVLNLTRGCYTFISPAIFNLRGLTVDEAMNEKLEDSLTPDSLEIVKKKTEISLEKLLANPQHDDEPKITEIQQPCKNGQLIWVEVATKMGFNEQGEIEVTGVSRNIEERKKAEAIIRKKNKELETYLYVVSHDLRSPLINIQGFTARISSKLDKVGDTLRPLYQVSEELAQLQKFTEEIAPQSLSIIMSNVEKMNDLINGLLTISRTGQQKMNIVKCNMDALIKKILNTNVFQQEQAEASVNTTPLPPCYGDETILNQLFSNLIDNAIKYRHPERPLQIAITGKSANKHAIYSIKDNGKGISEKNQQRIWDVFYRVDPACQVKGEGIGLNLATKIVEKHQGSIWVESIEGEGSTFFVKLKREEFQE